MMKVKLLLSIFLCSLIMKSYGQANVVAGEKNNDLAPGRNSYGVGGATGGSDIYSVDPYSGVGSVNIPIYDYSVDGMNFGVSLGYNNKGIQVSQIASSIGLGWDINAGGSITRTVEGIEDEIVLPALISFVPPYFNFSRPAVPPQRGAWYKYDNGLDDTTESTPDVWEAHFAGRTVKFLFHPWIDAWWTYSTDHVQVQILEDGQPLGNWIPYNSNHWMGPDENGHHISFVITDENFNKFYFEPGDKQKKWYKSDKSVDGAYYYVTSKWVMTKVITYTGREINYSYVTRDGLAYEQYKDQKVREVQNSYTYTPWIGYPFNNWTNPITAQPSLGITDSIAIWRGSVSDISEIKYPNGTSVTFNYDNVNRCDVFGMKVLGTIEVKSAYDNYVHNTLTYQLNHAYFNSPTASHPNFEESYPTTCGNISPTSLRLKLKSITKLGTDNNYSQLYYSFDYNNSLPLPDRMSYMQDYYGYYNNRSTTPLTYQNNTYYLGIPYHTVNLNFPYNLVIPVTYGMSKEPDFGFIKADILTSVTNASGGKVTFYYKDGQSLTANNTNHCYNYYDGDPLHPTVHANQIDPDLQYNDAFDGLIIDKVTNYDGFNSDNNSTIYYDYQAGERFFAGGYFWYPTVFTGNTICENVYQNILASVQPYPNGNNHGFKEVTITQKGYQNEQLSKTKYSFSGLANLFFPNDSYNNMLISCGPVYHTLPPRWIYSEFFGINTQTVDYDNDGYEISKNVNNFTLVGTAPNLMFRVDKFGFNIHAPFKVPCTNCFGDGFNYFAGTDGCTVLSKEHMYIWRNIVSRYSNHVEYKDTFWHSYDGMYHKTGTKWSDSKWQYWNRNWEYGYNSNFLQKTYVKNPAGDFIDHQQLVYDNDANGYHVSQVYKAFLAHPGNQTDVDNNNRIVKQYTFDDKGNIIQSDRNHLQEFVSYVWDSRIGQKVAQVANARYDDIAYTSFEGSASTYNPSWAALDYEKGNWIFDPANIACYTDQNGNPVADKPITGSYYFNLPAPNQPTPNQFISYKDLVSDRKYFLSFWTSSSSAAAFSVTGSNNVVTLTQQAHVGNWYLYTATVIGSGTQIHITNNSANIVKVDELRLHPVEAIMDTYTYQPLFGISSHCDERNNVTYYEYDALGRLKVTRDIDGNVLSLTKYVTLGTDN